MVFGTFVFYFIIFLIIFSFGKRNSRTLKTLFIIPGILAVLMVFLTTIKVFFLYKLFLVLIMGFIALLSYLQWGKQIRRWFEE